MFSIQNLPYRYVSYGNHLFWLSFSQKTVCYQALVVLVYTVLTDIYIYIYIYIYICMCLCVCVCVCVCVCLCVCWGVYVCVYMSVELIIHWLKSQCYDVISALNFFYPEEYLSQSMNSSPLCGSYTSSVGVLHGFDLCTSCYGFFFGFFLKIICKSYLFHLSSMYVRYVWKKYKNSNEVCRFLPVLLWWFDVHPESVSLWIDFSSNCSDFFNNFLRFRVEYDWETGH